MSGVDVHRKRRSYIVLVCTVCLPVLLVIAGLLFNLANYLGYNKRIEQIKAKGLPVDIESLNNWKPLSDRENGIDFIRSAAQKMLDAEAGFKTLLAKYPKWEGKDASDFQIPDHYSGLDDTIKADPYYSYNFMVKHAGFYRELFKLYNPVLDYTYAAVKCQGIDEPVSLENVGVHLMNCRILSLWLRARAVYDIAVLGDSDKCLEDIDTSFRLSECMYYGNPLINRLVALAINNISCLAFSSCVLSGNFSSVQLRKFAGKCADYKIDPVGMWLESMIGERAFMQAVVSKSWLQSGKLSDSPYLGNMFFTNRHANRAYAYFYNTFFFYYDMCVMLDSLGSVIEMKNPTVAEIHKLAEKLKRLSENSIMSDYITPMSLQVEVGLLIGALDNLVKQNVRLDLCAVAARVQADRMDGKAVPADLAAYPERDYFTGKPFNIATKGDYIYIYSVGADKMDSGAWDEVEVGSMNSSLCVDDMVLRLPLKKYNGTVRSPADKK